MYMFINRRNKYVTIIFQKFFWLTAPALARKTRGELMKNIDADYYGYRDEDDGRIIPLEQEMEKKGLIILCSYK